MNKGIILTDEQVKAIIKDYQNGIALSKISHKYKCGIIKIKTVLKENDIDFVSRKNKKKYSFDEHWLDNLDCAEKFYFLGFMFSDGNNCEKYNTCSIALQESDKDILIQFSNLLQNNRPLYYNAKTKSYCLRFCSEYFCQKLKELGCIPKKSLVLKFPSYIPLEYQRDFIRGYFDGDGGLSLNTKGMTAKADVSFAGTLDFNTELGNVLKNNLGDISLKLYTFNKTECTKLLITTQVDSFSFLDWIYNSSSIYLNRKYNKYELLKESRKKMKSNPSLSRKILKENKDFIIQQHFNGVSNCEIGRQLNVNKTTIGRFLRKNGVLA